MKVTMNVARVESVFGDVASVAPSRTPKPVLQNVKFSVDDGATFCAIEATDLEVGVYCRIDRGADCSPDRPGAALVAPAKLGQILRSGVTEIVMDADDASATISAGRARYKFPAEDPWLFPSAPEFPAPDAPGWWFVRVNAADLSTAISRTVFAVDAKSTRYALGGVLFVEEPNPRRLVAVATDGRRLAVQILHSASWIDTAVSAKPVVPARALKLFDRLIASENEVELAFNDRMVMLRTTSSTAWSRLVEGRFPSYRDVIPERRPFRAASTAGDLRDAVSQAAIATSEESRGVNFAFSENLLSLSASAPDVGASDVPVDVACAIEEPATIELDARFVVECLKTLPAEQAVDVWFGDAKSPVMINTEDAYTYIVVPLTKDR